MKNILTGGWTLAWMAIWGALASSILPNMFINWVTEMVGLAILVSFGILTKFIIEAPKLQRQTHVPPYI